MKALIVGAGVTGCFTAARLMAKGVDVAVLARGDRATRLERGGLQLRDGLTGEETTVRLDVVRSPVRHEFELAMVCVQATQRDALAPLLRELPGRPTIWYLGNTTAGYERAIEQLGRDRVLGGFPGVGGTWEGDRLLYADREKAGDAPLDRLTLGEAHFDAAAAADVVHQELQRAGMKIERYVPIMAWHWCHIAMVLPLAGAVYRCEQDLDRVVADRALLRKTMRATAQALTAIRRSGQPVLPRGLNAMRWIPAALGARRIASLLRSDFGRIALAAHAATARDEMRGFAVDLVALAGPNAGAELREVLDAV